MTTKDQATFSPKPGQFYDGVSNEDYHNGPGFSSTKLQQITQYSLMHFRRAPKVKQTPAMLLGNVLHTFILEPEEVDARYVFATGLKLNTNKGKEAMAGFKELAHATGRQVVREDRLGMEAIAKAVRGHGEWNHIVGPTPTFERSFYWTDEATGIFLKCRPDALNLSFGSDGHALIPDLKSGKDIRDRPFINQVVDLGYDFSAAMYCAGVEAVTGQKCGWAWFAFEKKQPFATRVIVAGPRWLARGKALFRSALEQLAEARKTGEWPGQDNGRAVELPFPRWAELGEGGA